MMTAAEANGVRLMVGTMKRYDPAYERLEELLPAVADLRLIRVTTLESPLAPYVAHHPLVGPAALPTELLAGRGAADARRRRRLSATPTSRRAGATGRSCSTTSCTS